MSNDFDRDNNRAHHHRRARFRYQGRGVFPHQDVEKHEFHSLPNNDDELKIDTLVTVLGDGGPTVTAIDCELRWKDHKKDGVPSTTHELAFDRVNGFDNDYVYVSGMTVDMIARVKKSNPRKQDIFRFPSIGDRDAQPHTLTFATIESSDLKGKLWVGLEEQGIIVKLDMREILEKYSETIAAGKPVDLNGKEDYKTIYDVRITSHCLPTPLNTRPHGFCFDHDNEKIWFTGKLTNTVGCIGIDGSPHSLQHFELPTLGAVPIYVTLGSDKNIWGTCLNSSMIFRVTTKGHPTVQELPISDTGKDHRPIVIQPDPRKDVRFMWFSNEASHSVCRLDIRAFNHEFGEGTTQNTGKCNCSSGCKFINTGSNEVVEKIVTEFPIPKLHHGMKLGGLAISTTKVPQHKKAKLTIWTQSYMDPTENEIDRFSDYVLRLRFDKHEPTYMKVENQEKRVNMTGLPVEYFELPTKDTILHRISLDSIENGSVWFTELGSDRLGTIEFSGDGSNKGKNKAARATTRKGHRASEFEIKRLMTNSARNRTVSHFF